MADISVAILGLGRVGASVALALKRYNAKGSTHHFKVTGFDTRPQVEKKANSAKITDELVNRAYNAVRDKDIVVIALPYAEVRPLYELIKDDLRSGAVVMDMSPLALPSLAWGEKNLPDGVYLVGVKPVINPDVLFQGVDDIELAREDLFDKGSMLLMPSANCAKDAVQLAVDFSSLLGSSPHFVDASEHDGLAAATEGLPSLLGVAAFYQFSNSAGWPDGQRMINPSFGALTHHLFDTHPDDLRDLWLHNRDNMLRYVDELLATLREIRARLAESDANALEALLVEASENYEIWLNRRYKGVYDDMEKIGTETGSMNDILKGMMGGFIANRLTGKKNKGD